MTTTYDWVIFRGVSPRGERRRGSLEQLIEMVTTRHKAWTKDQAPGFSATRYREHYIAETYSSISKRMISFAVDAPAAYRCNAAPETICALVQDVDHVKPDWDHLERTGNLVITYTTWSDTPDDPHSRVIVPLAAPVLAEEWPSCWQLGLERFDPNADPSCKDVSRFYYLPAAKPLELDRIQIRVIDGAPWAPDRLTVAPTATQTFMLGPVSDREATAEETDAAHRILAAACRRLAEWPPGAGRQVKCYGVARLVGHLIAAGAISEEEAVAALEHAVDVNGVLAEREYEARRAIARGLAKGVADGAYIFEPLQNVRLRRAEAELACARDLSAQPRPRTYDITTAGGRR